MKTKHPLAAAAVALALRPAHRRPGRRLHRQRGRGGMGIHYVKNELVGDSVVDAASPEALVYEPRRSGRLRLVAVEYVVFQEAWDAAHASPPEPSDASSN